MSEWKWAKASIDEDEVVNWWMGPRDSHRFADPCNCIPAFQLIGNKLIVRHKPELSPEPSD